MCITTTGADQSWQAYEAARREETRKKWAVSAKPTARYAARAFQREIFTGRGLRSE